MASSSRVSYGISPTIGTLSTLDGNLVISHSVTLTGLTAGSNYSYAAISGSGAGSPTTSPTLTFSTPVATGPVIFGVDYNGITSTSATITWRTNQVSTSSITYGTSGSLSTVSPMDNTLVTSHSVTLTGLTPGTGYSYAVISSNGPAASTTSPIYSFQTVPLSATGPVIGNLTTYGVDNNSASILWNTDVSATSLVNYGVTSAYGLTSTPNSSLGLNHVVPLTGLTPGTTYHFNVVTANASNVASTSKDFTFTTTVTAPLVFTLVTATNITSTSATISWTTDRASTSRVSYGTTSAYGSQSALDTALVTFHSVTLTGLTPGTSYNYVALSTTATVVAVPGGTGGPVYVIDTVPPAAGTIGGAIPTVPA